MSDDNLEIIYDVFNRETYDVFAIGNDNRNTYKKIISSSKISKYSDKRSLNDLLDFVDKEYERMLTNFIVLLVESAYHTNYDFNENETIGRMKMFNTKVTFLINE